MSLGAGHDINLQAVTDTSTLSTDSFQNHTETSTGQSDQTVRGTSIAGAHGISIAAETRVRNKGQSALFSDDADFQTKQGSECIFMAKTAKTGVRVHFHWAKTEKQG